MRKTSIRILAVLIGLSAAANAVAAGLFSATRPVIAIVAGDLFVGEAEGNLSGAGTLAIHSQKDPALTCVGNFVSTSAAGGSGEIQCSDGVVAMFQFARLSVFTGHGAGSFSRGTMSFAYGISATEAGSYLKLPEGKRLAFNGGELVMVDL